MNTFIHHEGSDDDGCCYTITVYYIAALFHVTAIRGIFYNSVVQSRNTYSDDGNSGLFSFGLAAAW